MLINHVQLVPVCLEQFVHVCHIKGFTSGNNKVKVDTLELCNLLIKVENKWEYLLMSLQIVLESLYQRTLSNSNCY